MIDCEAVIFDLDGTLIDSLHDLGNAVNKALSDLGYPQHEINKYKNYIGGGTEAMVTRALPEDKRNESNIKGCLRRFNEIYEKEFNVETTLYEDIPSLLDKLAQKNKKLSILTNKPIEFTKKYVEAHLGHWNFEMVIGQIDGTPRKPDPTGANKIIDKLGIDPSKIVYLGDTSVDMLTAVNAGMYPVGVLWGFRDKEELLSNGASSIIEKPLELIDLIN